MKELFKGGRESLEVIGFRLAFLLAAAGLASGCAQPTIGGGGFVAAACGNAVCEAGELTSCPSDCAQGCRAPCTAAVCTAAGEIQDCVTGQTGCKVLAAAKACPSGQKCSAGQCTGSGTSTVGCGDGVCATGEKASCPLDCPGGCSSPCSASVCGPGGGVQECTAGPDGCSVLGAEKACPAGSQCTGDACVSMSKDHVKIESVKFFGEKTGFPTYLAPMFGKTVDGSKFSVVHDLVLTNSTADQRTVTVKAWLQGFSEEGGTAEPLVLAPGETKTITHIDIPFTCGKLDPVVTDTQATYKLAIYENGVEVDARKANVTMLPRGTVLWLPPAVELKTEKEVKLGKQQMNIIMASLFTTKNDSWGEVDKLVAEASKLATVPLTGSSMKDKSDAELQAYATEALVVIFKALKARGVDYSSVGTDFFEFGQNVRYPAESLTVGSQNCIDGALVFASALERMDYYPVIVMIQGHAFVGARAAKAGPLVFIETTMVGSTSAEKAVTYAFGEVTEHFDEISPDQFVGKATKIWSHMVEVRELHEDGGLPSSFFPCGAKPAPASDPCGTNPQCKCQKSLDCKRNGKCTVVSSGTGCGVVTSEDCAKSTDCTDWGKCSAVLQNGQMVCGKAGSGPVCGNAKCEVGENSSNCIKDCPAAGPVCGNAKCEVGENSSNCIKDCPAAGPVCGNAKCEVGENSSNCIKDCPAAGPVCGNAKCEMGENSSNCIKDCPAAGPVCGNGLCESGETTTTCNKDCAVAAAHPCDSACGGKASSGCFCDAECMTAGDCCDSQGMAAAKTCAGSTCAVCGGGAPVASGYLFVVLDGQAAGVDCTSSSPGADIDVVALYRDGALIGVGKPGTVESLVVATTACPYWGMSNQCTAGTISTGCHNNPNDVAGGLNTKMYENSTPDTGYFGLGSNTIALSIGGCSVSTADVKLCNGLGPIQSILPGDELDIYEVDASYKPGGASPASGIAPYSCVCQADAYEVLVSKADSKSMISLGIFVGSKGLIKVW